MLWKKDNRFLAFGTVSKKAMLKTTTTNKLVCTFSVAADKDSEDNTIFIDCKAWSNLAGYCADLEKGDSFAGAGRITKREYNGKTYTDYVLDWANSPMLATSAPAAAPAQNAESAPKKQTTQENKPKDNGRTQWHEEDADEDDLPF